MATRIEIIDDTRDMLRHLAEPAGGLSIKAQQNRVARLLGWPIGRILKLWWGNGVPRAEEYVALLWKVAATERANDQRRARQAEVAELLATIRSDRHGDRASCAGRDDGEAR